MRVYPLVCPGTDLRSGFPGVRSHRPCISCPDAPSWPFFCLLSLLRQLWREDAAEADVIHRLSPEDPLLEHVFHDSCYFVSMWVCFAGGGGANGFDDLPCVYFTLLLCLNE